MKNKIEILSPAGSYDNFLAAVNAGADAIYLGGTAFGARAYSNNFDETELLKAIDYAHLHDRKVYLAVNTLLKDEEITEKLYDYLRPYYMNGLDAVIVQDLGVFDLVKKRFPELAIHASTQMTITGKYGAAMLKDMGASRVVLARELNLDEIKDISDNVDIEIEAFVHGALCYCYSGQCLLSSLIGGRSGNRGRCAQPCRLPYDILSDERMLMDRNEKYILSPKDMNALTILPQVIESGVDSLKIEGRMKSREYTAGVVSMYRKYLDMYLEKGSSGYRVSEDDLNNLKDLYNRGGFTNGYYTSRNGKEMLSVTRPNHQGTQALEVLSSNKGCITCRTLEPLYAGDLFEIAADLTYTNKDPVKKGEKLVLNIPSRYPVKTGDIINRTRNNNLMKSINELYIDTEIKKKLNGQLVLRHQEPACFTVSLIGEDGGVRAVASATGELIEKAQNQPATIDRVKKQIQKTGSTPYEFSELEIIMDEDIFVPVQQLNDLRRNAIASLEENLMAGYRRHETTDAEDENQLLSDSVCRVDLNTEVAKTPLINVSIENRELLPVALEEAAVNAIYIEMSEYPKEVDLINSIEECRRAGKKVYLTLPHIFRMRERERVEKNVESLLAAGPDGFVVRNLEEAGFLRQYALNHDCNVINIITDNNLYTFNKNARSRLRELEVGDRFKIEYDSAPVELNSKELKRLGISGSELQIYGYIPVMVTAQCINKTTSGCDSVKKTLYLKDRKNKKFAVRNNCTYCYNTIYNTSPLYLTDKTEEIAKLSPKSVRLSFSLEDRTESKKILHAAVRTFVKNERQDSVITDFTRGHFLRGVE